MHLRDLKYLIAYLAPLSAFIGLYLGGWWSFGAIYIGFLIVPLFEFFLPQSKENFPAEEEALRQQIAFFDYILYLHVPITFTLLWYFFERLSAGGLATYELVGMTLNVGMIIGSFGINVAHELGHRAKTHEQIFAKLLLTPALYTHFNIEHNRGHHKHVATPEDPSSARLGESLYAFWIRSVTQTYIKAWQLEATRLKKEGLSVFSFANEMIWFQGYHLTYLLAVGYLFGWAMVPYAIGAAVFGFLLLETVNYIEHYGLLRKKLPSGRYERVSPSHSWNSNHEMGRIYLYELTRHADHHYKADRKYQILRHLDESPQLPLGYPASMVVALLPPLWFKLMNKRVALALG